MGHTCSAIIGYTSQGRCAGALSNASGGARLFLRANLRVHVCFARACVRSVTGDRAGLAALAADAREAGKHNVAFLGLFLLGRMQECMQLLVDAGRCARVGVCACWQACACD